MKWHIYNLLTQVAFDILLFQTFGFRPQKSEWREDENEEMQNSVVHDHVKNYDSMDKTTKWV